MHAAQPDVSVQDELFSHAAGNDAENFAAFFRKIRKTCPMEATRACLCYLAQKGLDAAGQKMALWLASEVPYCKVLFDNSALPLEIAAKATSALVKADPQFPAKFRKEAEALLHTPQILRALSLLPAISSNGLLPWLHKLNEHVDERVRSRAVKLLCELRPIKSQLEQLLRDDNARVRANAIEALWNKKTTEAAELFKAALNDTNHRVVCNALVGLHLQGDAEALVKIGELCQSPQIAVRRSMAWCLGFIADPRGIPLLQTLSKDATPVVRHRALRSLQALQPETPAPTATVEAAEGQLPILA